MGSAVAVGVVPHRIDGLLTLHVDEAYVHLSPNEARGLAAELLEKSGGSPGLPQIYDICIDNTRAVTQADIDELTIIRDAYARVRSDTTNTHDDAQAKLVALRERAAPSPKEGFLATFRCIDGMCDKWCGKYYGCVPTSMRPVGESSGR